MKHTGKMLVVVLLTLWGETVAAQPTLPRVVSLDSCADQYVLALADDAQIMALTRNAQMPFSYYKDKAMAFPTHDGRVESLLAFKPDVAVATGMGDPALTQLLGRLGIKVVVAGLSPSIEASRKDMRIFGEALAQDSRATRLLADFDDHLARLKSAPQLAKSALYLSPGGTTTGRGTFLDEIITLGGYTNLMTLKGLSGWAQMNVEDVVMDQPDVVIGGFFDARVGQADVWRFASHPVIMRLMAKATVIDVPSHLISCPAWYALEAADMIRAQGLKGE